MWKYSALADIDVLVSLDDLSGLFAFTPVRNPWDRVASYCHWLREQSFAHPAVQSARELDFEGFVLHPHTLATLRHAPALHAARGRP